MLQSTQAILLAAGKAARLNTGNTKLIEKVCGQEIILYHLAVLKELNLPVTMVIGFQGKNIKQVVEKTYPNEITYVEQHEQNGTAAALQLTKKQWESDHILVLKADIPLINSNMIEALYKKHRETNAAISFITAHNGDPSGFSYSRVIKKENKIFIRKSQELSFDEMQEHCCVNSGIYFISRSFLQEALPCLEKNDATGEYHISDLINIAHAKELLISTLSVPFDQIRGINTYQELWAVEHIKRAELIKYWMDRGVRFSAAQTVHMDLDVEIGTGSFIGCSVHLLSGTKIGSHCTIHPFTIIENSTLDNHAVVHPHSIIRNTVVGEKTHIGPFAHLRQNSRIGENCFIGNFVETSQTSIANNSKAKHLAYLGNAQIGSHVNIGAGTITCNYDGKQKHTTHIKYNVFIGTNNSLVAPITIESKSFTAAGSTITEDVPPESLAIGRARQVTKEGYLRKSKEPVDQKSSSDPEKSVSFIGAYKTHNDAPTTDK